MVESVAIASAIPEQFRDGATFQHHLERQRHALEDATGSSHGGRERSGVQDRDVDQIDDVGGMYEDLDQGDGPVAAEVVSLQIDGEICGSIGSVKSIRHGDEHFSQRFPRIHHDGSGLR